MYKDTKDYRSRKLTRPTVSVHSKRMLAKVEDIDLDPARPAVSIFEVLAVLLNMV